MPDSAEYREFRNGKLFYTTKESKTSNHGSEEEIVIKNSSENVQREVS